MRIDEYISDLRRRNIIVTVHDGQLAVNDPDDVLTSKVIDELKTKKSEIVDFFKTISKQKGFETIPRAPKGDSYPLSSTQSRMYFLQTFDKGSTAYNMPVANEVLGALDIEGLAFALRSLINRHESLRTVFRLVDGVPMQYVLDGSDFEIEHGSCSKDEVDEAFREFIRPFNLSSDYPIRVRLITIDEGEYFLFMDLHHIVSDLVSISILVQDLMAYYQGKLLPELPLQYKDYAHWQQSSSQRESLGRHKDFWLSEFSEESYPLELPTISVRPLVKNNEGASLGFVIDRDTTRALRAISEDVEATLFMNLFAIYNVLLSKLSNTDDIIVGTPVSGRPHPDLEHIVGMFVNTLPVRNHVDTGIGFRDFLVRIKDKVLECLDHQFYEYESLVEDLNISRDTGRNPLFDVMFVFQKSTSKGTYPTDLRLKGHSSEVTTSKFDLTLFCREEGEQIFCDFEYYTGIFNAEVIQDFADYFKHLVLQVVKSPDLKILDLALMEESTQEQLLSSFNDTFKVYGSDETIHGLFEAQVFRTPEAEAVSFKGVSLSYRELNARSNQLAFLLRGKGSGPGKVIGIYQHRSFEMVISILAILKSGGAYLPIDPDYPLNRLEKMVVDSNMLLLLTDSELPRTISENVECLDVGQIDFTGVPAQDLNNENGSFDLLYVLYTSGSTGIPKGVMMNHQNLVNLMDHHINGTNIDTSSVLQFTTLTFDPSFAEIFSALLTGGKLHLIEEEVSRDFSKLLMYMKSHEVRSIFMPSSVLNQMFNSKEYLEQVPTTLRNIVTAGEQVVVGELFKKYLKDNHVYLHNHYGPAETHVVTSCTISPFNSIPCRPSIGKPIQNTQIYILDEGMHEQPINVPGEIYIGGDQLGNGYLSNPKLTSERFIDNPFLSGDKLYRTGDLARWVSSGNIEFLGRVDNQIKLNGVRIEPGEIESHLNSMDSIVESVAIVREIRGDKALIAYYVSKEEITAAEFRAYLIDRLPLSMIPNYFIHLSEMPLTATGKLYRKALPVPEIKKEVDYIAPSNQTEKCLATIWSEILNLDENQVSTNRSFFELGGQSLKAIRMVNSIFKVFSVEISLKEIFVKQTIRCIANYIITVKQLDEVEENNEEEIKLVI